MVPIPILVLTGFLGAGKTTFLNRLLGASAFVDTAVIVNEFGDVGIDHLLVEAIEGDCLVLTTGCVCCAARGDLLAALDGLLERQARLGFRRILIETTGLADPGPILNAILLGPGLGGAVRAAGVVTLVSAVDGDATLDRYDEARRQVVLADRILITKSDLVADGAAMLRTRLAALAPMVPIADAREAVPDVALFAAVAPIPVASSGTPHHHHAADARIRAVVLDAGTVDADRLGAFVSRLQERHGSVLLRLKGIVALRHAPDRPVLIQAVGPLLHPATILARWPGPDRRTRLVVILDGVDPVSVVRLWDAFVGGPAIDRPDAQALMGEGGMGLLG